MKKKEIMQSLLKAIEADGRSDKAISLAASDSPRLVARLKQNGNLPNTHNFIQLCEVLDLDFYIGLPVSDIPTSDIEISYLGKISAGGGYHPDEARFFFAQEGETISAPPHISTSDIKRFGGLYAASVAGESMCPSYNEGDLVMFYPNDPASYNFENLIGKDCAVELEDDCMMLKRLRRGDKLGTFNLESINPRWGTMTSQIVRKACPIRYVQRKI